MSVKERDKCQFLKALNNKNKFNIYNSFGKEVSLNIICMGYLSDIGTCLPFMFRNTLS